MKTEDKLKANCDSLVASAALMMQADGASIGMILDRLLTYAAAQACTMDGSQKVAEAFRIFADKIEGGLFHRITGEDGASSGVRH